MKPIDSYFLPIKDNAGQQVAWGFDAEGYAIDMGIELFPDHEGKQKAYAQGYVDCIKMQAVIQQEQKAFIEREAKKPRLVVPDQSIVLPK